MKTLHIFEGFIEASNTLQGHALTEVTTKEGVARPGGSTSTSLARQCSGLDRIDTATGGASKGADIFKDLTEKEIIAKAHLVNSIKFLHACKMAHRGAILMTWTDDNAKWLWSESIIRH